MHFQEFKELFLTAIDLSVTSTESITNKTISRNYEIILHGAGFSEEAMSVDDAAEFLYINQNEFYYVIDVAVFKVTKQLSQIFVRASGHYPVSFDKTWNAKNGTGPFKCLVGPASYQK